MKVWPLAITTDFIFALICSIFSGLLLDNIVDAIIISIYAKQKKITKVHLRSSQQTPPAQQIRQTINHPTHRLSFLKFCDRNRCRALRASPGGVYSLAAKEQIRTVFVLLRSQISHTHCAWERSRQLPHQLHTRTYQLWTHIRRNEKIYSRIQSNHVPWWIGRLQLLPLFFLSAANVFGCWFSNSFEHKFRGRPKGSKNRRK